MRRTLAVLASSGRFDRPAGCVSAHKVPDGGRPGHASSRRHRRRTAAQAAETTARLGWAESPMKPPGCGGPRNAPTLGEFRGLGPRATLRTGVARPRPGVARRVSACLKCVRHVPGDPPRRRRRTDRAARSKTTGGPVKGPPDRHAGCWWERIRPLRACGGGCGSRREDSQGCPDRPRRRGAAGSWSADPGWRRCRRRWCWSSTVAGCGRP